MRDWSEKALNNMSDEKPGTLRRFAGKGLYPHQLAWVLLIPLRNLYLSPRKLAARLAPERNHKVLELGCGPGYYSPYIAKQIPDGKLFLADVQQEMLEKAQRRLNRKHVANYDVQVCNGQTLDYPDAFFDSAFLITVLGEIQNQESHAKELFRVLKVGGMVSISEQAGDPDSLSIDYVRSLLEPVGFSLKQIFGKGRTYTANFTK